MRAAWVVLVTLATAPARAGEPPDLDRWVGTFAVTRFVRNGLPAELARLRLARAADGRTTLTGGGENLTLTVRPAAGGEGWVTADPFGPGRAALADGRLRLCWVRAVGRRYRLPDEAEWEYACRAGTTTAYHFGAAPDPAAAALAGPPAARPVGRFPANPFGLFDAHGGAAELCLSRGDYWAAAEPSPPAAGRPLVARGGSRLTPQRTAARRPG